MATILGGLCDLVVNAYDNMNYDRIAVINAVQESDIIATVNVDRTEVKIMKVQQKTVSQTNDGVYEMTLKGNGIILKSNTSIPNFLDLFNRNLDVLTYRSLLTSVEMDSEITIKNVLQEGTVRFSDDIIELYTKLPIEDLSLFINFYGYSAGFYA